MSEITTMFWLDQNRWLVAAVSGSVALHSAVLAFAPAPAQHTKPPAPLIVRVEDSHSVLREARAAPAAPASNSSMREAHSALPAPSSHSTLREAHAAPPVQHIQRAQKAAPQATASLRSDVDKKPGPPEPAPVAVAAGGAPPAAPAEPAPVALAAGGAPPAPTERPMEAQVALLTVTPAASPGQGPASMDRAAPASAAGEQRAALDKLTPSGGPGSSDESDQGVAYLYNPAPAYPLEARRLHLEGEVLLQVRVDRTGEPREARIARSSGVALLDEAALTGVRAWRFSAAKHGNTPIEHWVAVPIRFRLEGRHVD